MELNSLKNFERGLPMVPRIIPVKFGDNPPSGLGKVLFKANYCWLHDDKRWTTDIIGPWAWWLRWAKNGTNLGAYNKSIYKIIP